MKAAISTQFRGTYELVLKRKDGSVQREVVHNIATSNIVSVTGSRTLSIGSGSGEPSVTDTKLFTHLWNLSPSSTSQVQNIGDDGARMSLTYIVPATTDYVATITEVGMGAANAIWTHALLVDAEGNPISIVKTENDELTIVVTLELYASTTLRFTTAFERFVSVPVKPTLAVLLLTRSVYPTRQWQALFGGSYNSNYSAADLLSIRPRNLRLPHAQYYLGTDYGVTPTSVSWTADKSLMQLKLADNLRCKNDAFNTRYYRYMSILWGCMTWSGSGVSYSSSYYLGHTNLALDLRDPNIFPPQLLSNITLATGDGETTDFACPLNYFQKDTEVVYKNGIRLTRGVDYTIDNESNKDCLPELMHIIYPDDLEIKITSGSTVAGAGYLQFQAEPYVTKSANAIYDDSMVCTSFDQEHPLHFDWGAARKCDRLVGQIYARYTGTMYVEYSADDLTWEEAASMSISNSSTSSITNLAVDLSWNTVEARYWRIRVTRYGTNTTVNHIAYFSTGGKEPYLGHSNPLGVHFATPPAADDVITMDCYVDIPLKSTNFAFNLALDLTIMFG